jgi:hypothetical protein
MSSLPKDNFSLRDHLIYDRAYRSGVHDAAEVAAKLHECLPSDCEIESAVLAMFGLTKMSKPHVERVDAFLRDVADDIGAG